ncbi:MAG TPA: helix-turn-helix transcriptional regulator [Dongiaceae bacterium]|nr:helix-turn-helix transcriptional regulator [Dongiaceae bacterium]
MTYGAWTCARWSDGTSLGLEAIKGLTQEALAERSGFSQQYISGLENGLRNPTIVTIYELSKALGVPYLDLLRPAGKSKD